jgi:hypothetical protein
MTLNGSRRPDVEEVLSRLKDFQRSTVEYIFRRLYTDPDHVSRFLIADEVGLGKTLVARGVIARAVDHLWDTIPRIDVVYICSNQSIAQQNIDRLNITADRSFQHASRATLLPITLRQLRGNRLNFVSLTPGTSFNLRSQSGWMHERAVLYTLLGDHWDVPEGALRNVLRGNVRKDRWKRHLEWFEREKQPTLDEELRQAFYDALEQTPELRAQYDAVAAKIGGRRKHLTQEMRQERNHLIGKLRRLLARSSLAALEPDLVILDEFQRFKYLLEDEGDIALLARELFDFPDVKILLLSATPYKMYTLQGEEGEDHYADFHRTVEFLLRDRPAAPRELKCAVDRYRRALFHLGGTGREELQEAKGTIESILRQVMVRTERLAASAGRNGMLSESFVAQDQVQPADLAGYVHLDRVARAVGAEDQVEYWKSSAYPLNLMDDYKLKRRFTHALLEPDTTELAGLLRQAQRHLLSWDTIQAYQALDPGNARLRALSQDSVETGNWKLLWLPPSLPYYQRSGPFHDIQPDGCTKTLVFSAWKLVPKAIAMLLSYEAERRMLEEKDLDFAYAELTDRRRPLLTFTWSRGRLTGMPVFCLIYPCLTLAQRIDPLSIARDLGEPLHSCEPVFEAAKAQVRELLDTATGEAKIPLSTKEGGRTDERWYWAALALLDRHFYRGSVGNWLFTEKESLAWGRMLDKASMADTGEEEGEGEVRRFAEHIEVFRDFFRNLGWQPDMDTHGAMQLQFEGFLQDSEREPLGRQPEDLLDILTYVALSGPAVVSLRAMLRITQPRQPEQWPSFLAAAARTGLAFRTLFNQPDVISLLQRFYPQGAYWGKVLHYCLDGHLQAVMDEYVHVLHESLGLVGHAPVESAAKMSQAIQTALTLRAPTLRFDEIMLSDSGSPTMEKRGLRCRYALRFGDEKSADYGGRTRDVDVQTAFNSPFRPFVLATTSIGQEGLDFHQYCHRVVHWNLPSNPVDLEQREGRVHRYKGHVIRRNIALHYGLSAIDEKGGALIDLWQQLFERAIKDRPKGSNDLVPFWIYETGGPDGQAFKIERKIPVLPLSREIGRMERLKRSLVAYRSVIGQPRQQELLEFLAARLDDDDIHELVRDATIDLSPPQE